MTATTNPKPAHSRAHAAEVAMIVRRGLVTVLLAAGLMVMPGVARASALRPCARRAATSRRSRRR